MSHYVYQPLTGQFKSNADVNLSFEEMRWEYYQEIIEKAKLSNLKRCKGCLCGENVENKLDNEIMNDNINRQTKIKLKNENRKNGKENIQVDDDWENMSIDEEPKNTAVKCPLHGNNKRSKLPEQCNSDVNTNENDNEDDIEKRKRGYEYDCEDLPNLKRMKVIGEPFSRLRSINDEVDMLSTSIVNSSKKKNRMKRKNYKNTVYKSQQNCTDSIEEDRIRDSIIELRKAGNELVKIGDYLSAFNKYSEALETSGKYSDLSAVNYSNRSFALMKLNRFTEALQDCDEAIRHNNREFKARLRRIKCLMELDRYEEAKSDVLLLKAESNLSECDQLLENINAKQEYSRSLTAGQRFEESRNYTEALSCYSRAISIDDNSSSVFQKRACVLYHLARYREALGDLNEALRLNPMNVFPIYNRVGVLLKLERFQEAIRDAEELNRRDPSVAHRNLLRASIDAEKSANKRNYYEILELDRKSTVSEIKKQYRKMALMYHPDKLDQVDPLTRSQQEEKFKKLTLILKTLSDPVSRQIYDMSL